MEQKTEQKTLTVGDLDIDSFVELMSAVLDRRREKGDPKLIDMSVKEFTGLMLDQLRTRAMTIAQAETSTAERILTDWQGLQAVNAVTQPFRMRNAAEVAAFAESLAAPLREGMRGEFVVAVAIADGNAYRDVPR